ncbi:MAG: DNA polymerase III subunit gamma/tau [Lachnospiraceae bacterium]|nr:DNA polymerase III subunit gamma/tau [Lachnospiraceae bacterium]
MSYTALYRKFRPLCFEDVKGQEHIVTTLKNQIRAERVGHAYLFTGTRGTGKTTIAKILARAVNCENPKDGSPCGECASCKRILAGVGVNVIEMDAASNNGVEDVRGIVEDISYSPAEGKYKVYIIDEVHMLSPSAFNALLKTLEEPPAYVIFILATTEVHKIPITILSRCQRYDFKRISIETIAARLRELMEKESVQVQDRALYYIAKTADGSMRDALSLLERCVSFYYGEELTYDRALEVLGAVDTDVFSRLFRSVLEQDVAGCISKLEELIMQGRELVQFVGDFTWYLRNLLLIKTADTDAMEDVIDMSSDNLKKLKEEAQMTDTGTIMRYIRVLSELSGQLRLSAQKRIMIEMTLIKLCRPQMESDTESLADRVRNLERKVEKGIPIQNISAAGGSSAQGGTAKNDKAVRKAPLPAALPEEIRQVVDRWGSIAANTEQPMRTYLRGVRLSMDNENRLVLASADRTQYDWLSTEEHKAQVEESIAEAIGKRVEVRFEAAEDESELEENYPDLGMIHMEIEEE